MRNGTYLGLCALALALTLGAPSRASQDGNDSTPQSSTSTSSSTSDEKKTKDNTQETKHASCEKMCLADGEDPLDCEQVCIQVVAR